MISRRTLLSHSVALAALGVAGFFSGGRAMAAQAAWNKGKDGFAADGADVVAYFGLDSDARGVAGSDAYVADWNGGRWRFVSADNLAAFNADPARFAPQYGGYCAWAVAQGYTAHGDIDAWHVENGKLYLNYNRRIRNRWRKDIPGFIEQADRNWPGVLSA